MEKKVVLVGTYRREQLDKWILPKGYYNYPISAKDKISLEDCKRITELWLYSGPGSETILNAEFIGVKTRDELLEYDYPATKKPHSNRYLLFKVETRFDRSEEEIEKVLIRTKDFANSSPKVAKLLKDYLTSSERGEIEEAGLLPEALLKLPAEKLAVSESALQLDFFEVIGECVKKDVSFPTPENPKFKFIDLFAGIGGFRLAMQALGGECVFSSEWNPMAQLTYCENFGDRPFGDITKKSTKDAIPEKFDVLCAGFPCQAFSVAGYRKGFDDTRGTLFFDVAEIIKKHRPKAVFLENVKNLKGHDNGKTYSIIKNVLEKDLGYIVFDKIMSPAVYSNIPQNRERIFIVCFDPKQLSLPEDFKFEFPGPKPLTRKITELIDYSNDDESLFYRESSRYYPQLSKDMTREDTIYQWRRHYTRENKNNMCPTLTANMGGGGHNVPLILTKDGIRKLTPRECLNFQGYPENYAFPNIARSHQYMQAGNSVVVPLIQAIATRIIATLNL